MRLDVKKASTITSMHLSSIVNPFTCLGMVSSVGSWGVLVGRQVAMGGSLTLSM